jgi:hypothetical protein
MKTLCSYQLGLNSAHENQNEQEERVSQGSDTYRRRGKARTTCVRTQVKGTDTNDKGGRSVIGHRPS